MSLLPRVTERVRELVSLDFDTRGPDVCVAEMIDHLEHHNPEFLDMAVKCAADLGAPAKAMVGFSMFYRLLIAQLPATTDSGVPTALPPVSAQTRDLLVAEIDQKGSGVFMTDVIAELEENNPELLQMAHSFASRLGNYLYAMQGFALLYKSLLIQSATERAWLH